MKAPSVIIVQDAEGLALMGAEIFLESAIESVRTRGRFLAALSGGSTPRAMHRRLAHAPYASAIPWDRTHLFWVDERMVSYDDPASNYGAARLDLLDRIPIPGDHVHAMRVSEELGNAARLYEQEMRDVLTGPGVEVPAFDFISLGLGPDGHTASLFPGQPSLEVQDRWIVPVKGGNPDIFRLTMTYAILNCGRHILFLAMGEEKAGAVRRVILERDAALPAQRVEPAGGKITWLVDKAAASLMTHELASRTRGPGGTHPSTDPPAPRG